MLKATVRKDLVEQDLSIYVSLVDGSGGLKEIICPELEGYVLSQDEYGNVALSVVIGEQNRIVIADSIDLDFFEDDLTN